MLPKVAVGLHCCAPSTNVEILPLFYRNRDAWIGVMRHAITLNASYFNTHRMIQQYATNAYV